MDRSTTYEMAKRYYPEMWGKNRLIRLVKLHLLTEAEYEYITGETYSDGE